jgi:type IV secretory pathway VirB4 component
LGESDVTYLAAANHRNINRPFGIRQADRRYHIYIVGKTGTGKSTLLKQMALQDVAAGRGFALLDPHGDLVRTVVAAIPMSRRGSVTYLDTPKGNWTFNPLAGVRTGNEALAVAELVEVFKKIWDEEWGPRLEHLFRNILFTLFELPSATLGDIEPLLTDRDHRKAVAIGLKNEEVRHFWQNEFAGYSPAFRAVVTAPLLNKLGAFLTDPRLKRILTAERSSFDLQAIMDNGRVLLVNLSRGEIGEGPAMLLGALLTAKIGLAGLARADRAEEFRRDFHLYLDEFQNFTTLSLATMLAELRKYRVSMVLANQYLGQLDPAIRDAVIGNVGTLIIFRVSAADAGYLAREMAPTFEETDLIGLPNRHVYLRLMIDGEVSKAFSATTLAAPPSSA